MTPEETRARLLYRDGLMLVLDKPAGVAVHRGPKGGAKSRGRFRRPALRPAAQPALAHRLDRDTAGCLVLGRHHKALEKLGLLFKQGKIRKTYWAVVAGAPEADERRDRPAARPAGRQARLVDEGRSEGARGADALAGEGKGRCGGTSRSPGSSSSRKPGERINCVSTAPRRAGRSSATRSTARAPACRCSCWRARSSCRCPRQSRRSRSRRPRRRICSRRSQPAGLAGIRRDEWANAIGFDKAAWCIERAVIARSEATWRSSDRRTVLVAPGLLTWGFSRKSYVCDGVASFWRLASDPWFEPVCEIWRWAGSTSHSVVAFRATAP